MTCSNKFASLAAAFVAMTFLSSCGDAKAGMPTPAGGSRSVPGYGEGTGSSGQTSAAKFLYANPLPGGGPYAQSIQSNGTLTSAVAGSPNNVNPRTMAIDPSGSFVFQTAEGYNGGTQGGLFVYQINRSNGSLGQATSSYLTSQAVYSDVVDNQGKFLYVQAAQGVYGFSIQSGTGTLTQITGSPFAASGPSSPGYSQPATLMAVDQMNHFLYVSTTSGIAGFTINQTTGQLAPIAGSPFGAGVNGPWTIVVTPNNGFLYELESQNSSTLHGYSIDQNTGVLTALQGSPFSTGTCGSLVAPGTVGIPDPDNMTIATAGKFMYDNCGIYSLDPTTGTVAQVSSSGPGDWPVIDPTGNFLWAITSDQQSCFHCDIGVTTYQVDPNTGALTPVPNSFLLLTNSAVGSVDSLAITQ
jgi:6-phosphogluconolactonase (cycloisomerase 2 family)